MDELRVLLDSYPSKYRATRIEPLGNAGGMSGAKFWRITTSAGALMLRCWPTEHPTSDRLRFIHAVIQHAALAVDFLPVPIKANDGGSFLSVGGHLWELAPWLPGAANYEIAPSEGKMRAAMTALAQFHHATSDFQPFPENAATLRVASPPALPRRLARLRELNSDRIKILSNAINDTTWPELAVLAHQFITALPHAVPRAIARLEPLTNIALPLQPCLRDIWHDHVLFTGNQVTGLVDFGALDIDTPATDIARLLGSLAPTSPPHFAEGHRNASAWQTGLDAYNAIRPLSQNESRAIHAIDAANPILAGCNWITWIYVDRRKFENRQQVLGRFRNIVDRLNAT
jgi:homoserine kinase type II